MHPWILSFWLTVLPRMISKRAGLYRDEKGRPRINLRAILPASLVGSSSDGPGSAAVAKYPDLPGGVCAICWERMEDQAGIKTAGQSVVRSGMPSLNPTDPSSSPIDNPSSSSPSRLPIDGAGHPIQPRGLAARTTTALSNMASSSGLAYADALVHTPYRAVPCGHTYCYVCLAGKLLSDEAAEELQDSANDTDGSDEKGDGGAAAWHCLRCGQGVRTTRRDDGNVILQSGKGKAIAKDSHDGADEGGADKAEQPKQIPSTAA